jgi:hypothetical protein
MCGTTYSRTAARASESAQAQHRPEGRPQRNLTAQNTRTHTGAAQALGVGKNVDWGKRRARVDAARGGRGEGTCRICNIEPPGLFGLPAARQCGSLRGAPALRRHSVPNKFQRVARSALVSHSLGDRTRAARVYAFGRQALPCGLRRRRMAGCEEGRSRRAGGKWGDRREGTGGGDPARRGRRARPRWARRAAEGRTRGGPSISTKRQDV